MSGKNLPSTGGSKQVAAFLARANSLAPVGAAKTAPKGRLIYAMDATARLTTMDERMRLFIGNTLPPIAS
jgi:hypothetical protein